jgi:SLOG cluster3 family
MKTFFLSASIPLLSRHPQFYETADVVAIRESLRGFLAAVLPTSRIVFGGHPAITPMFRLMAQEMNLHVRNHVVLYQSRFFRKEFPPDNEAFEHIVITDERPDRNASLAHMRERMLSEHVFDGAVFIGGMEGIYDEWELFGQFQKGVLRLPIATTGAAARMVFDHNPGLPEDLATEYAYLHLFRRHLLGDARA